MNVHKLTKWWKKVFFHLLETSKSNASALFKTFYDAKRFDLNKFWLNLVCQLLEYYDRVDYKIFSTNRRSH